MPLNQKIDRIVDRLAGDLARALRQIVREEAHALLQAPRQDPAEANLDLVPTEGNPSPQARETLNPKRLVMKALWFAKGGLSKEQLAHRIGGLTDGVLSTALRELLQAQRIAKHGQGRRTRYHRVLVLGPPARPPAVEAKPRHEGTADLDEVASR